MSRLLLRETLFYSISKAIPGFFGLISVVLFMRLIGSEQYGQYSLLLSQCNLIVALGFGWLNQSKLRYFSKDYIHDDYMINQINGLIYSQIFCLVILTVLVFYQSLTIQIWAVSIITISTIGIFNYTKTYYQAKLMPKNIIFLTALQSLMTLVIPLILMNFFGYSVINLLLGVSFSFLLSTIILFKDNIKKLSLNILFKINITKNTDILKKWIVYGTPLSFWFAIGLLLPFLDRYYINYYLPNAELGMYASIQEILVRSFSLTIFPFTLALHPRIMSLWNNLKFQEAAQLMIKSFFLILLAGLCFLLIAWHFNDLIFLLIQSAIPQINIQSKILILPLLFAGFLWQLSLLTHKMLELNEQTKLMIFAIVPSLIINIIGNNYFLPKFGVIATAYAALFSAFGYFVITGIHFVFSIKKLKIL